MTSAVLLEFTDFLPPPFDCVAAILIAEHFPDTHSSAGLAIHS